MENDQPSGVETQDPQSALLDALGSPAAVEEQEEIEASSEEQESEGDEQAEEQEAEPEKPAVDQKFRVKVKNDSGEDEERDLSLEELAAGYMQSADYTRKTQALAAQEKQRQDEIFKAVQQTTQQAMQQLQAKQQQLSQVLGAIQAEQQKLTQQQEEAVRQQREQAMKHSLDYLSKELPGVNLKEVAPKLKEAGKKYGFSEEELSGFTDGRAIHLLHDAMKWRELQTAKPKALQKVVEAPKVIKPAAPQPRKTNQAATDRLRKTGRASELVNFL